MPSPALLDLQIRLEEVKVLANADPGRAVERMTREDSVLSNAINRSCVVLLSAHLEGFLESVATDVVDSWIANEAEVGNLPRGVRLAHVDGPIKSATVIADPGKRDRAVRKLFDQHAGWWVQSAVLTGDLIDMETILRRMSNPHGKAIRQFLTLVGIEIDDHLRQAGSGHLLERASSLIDLRNGIAHGTQEVTTTADDLDEYLRDIELLCDEVVEAAAQSVQSICGMATRPW